MRREPAGGEEEEEDREDSFSPFSLQNIFARETRSMWYKHSLWVLHFGLVHKLHIDSFAFLLNANEYHPAIKISEQRRVHRPPHPLPSLSLLTNGLERVINLAFTILQGIANDPMAGCNLHSIMNLYIALGDSLSGS